MNETSRTQPAVAVLATVLICLPLLGASQVLAHVRVDEFDAWLFAYYGKQLIHGRVLYEQLWDNKPPGIFWVNAVGLWVAGGSLAGPIALCAASVVAAWAAFLAVTRRLYGLGPACVAAVMAVVFLNQQYFHVGCNRPNTFFVLTELAAFLLYVRATAIMFPRGGSADAAGLVRSAGRWLLLAGFCAGLGLWFKQSAVAVAFAVGVHQVLLLVGRFQAPAVTVRRIGLFVVGWGAAVALAGAVLLATSDVRWAWHAIVGFNRNYFAAGVGSSWWPHWFGIKEQVQVMALPGILALATLVHAIAVRVTAGRACGPDDAPSRGHRPPMLLAMLWVWMAAAAYLALIGPHQRLPYFGIALPPLCMLAAHGVYLFFAWGRSADRSYPPYYLFVGVVWFGYMMIAPVENQLHTLQVQHYWRYDDPEPDEEAATAEVIRKYTQPEDTLFVWGYGPEVYWRADRPSAVRYIGTEKAVQLGSVGQSTLDEIVDGLHEAPPKALVVAAGTLDRIDDPNDGDPLDYHDLAEWVRANYHLAEGARKRNVWLRND